MAHRVLRLTSAVLASLTPLLAPQEPGPDPDRDGDGLSDFQEAHKYLTAPDRADSDGDGVPDGEWRERREYAYTVRSVVQVLRPVTPEYLCDDMQDARVLDETAEMVELEVIHYPFNTAGEAIRGDPRWREAVVANAALRPWLAPGPTADWTPALRMQIETALAEDGIDFASLDDAELVRRVAKWLCARAESHDGFSTFVTAFDERGAPFVPEGLRDAVLRERGAAALAQQWRREISAAGMFAQRARGSCSSSAIYLCGCLRALGVPARIVLVIPVIDANDQDEVKMAQRLQNHRVRRAVVGAAQKIGGTWTSHTFNEVWVGGRWRRLDYGKLGQGTFGSDVFGLCTHVATFRDWADARMPDTIGKRQTQQLFDDLFGTPNPYSTLALRDEFGVHCAREGQGDPLRGRVAAVCRGDDAALPEDVRAWFRAHQSRDLIARIEGVDTGELRDLLAALDPRARLLAEGQPDIEVALDSGCWWGFADHAFVVVRFGNGAGDLVDGASYAFVPRNEKPGGKWEVDEGVRVSKRR
jgi:hypothetical protein